MAEEGKDLGPEEHSIKVFLSGNSGNKEIVTHQQRIFMILNSLRIPYTAIDIAAPGHEDETDFMRANAKKKDGQRHVLPPQIFNGEKYCGDYDDFDLANEDDVLEEFLQIPRKTPKAAPVELDVVPAEAEKAEVGKLEGGEAPAEATSEPMETDKIGEQPSQENGVESEPNPTTDNENGTQEDNTTNGTSQDHEGELNDQESKVVEEDKEDNVETVDSNDNNDSNQQVEDESEQSLNNSNSEKNLLDLRLTNGNDEGDNKNSCSNGVGIQDDLQNGLNDDDGQENEHMNGDKDDEEDLNGLNMNGLDDSNSTSDDELTNKRKSTPAIDLGDQRAESGCKDLRNIRKFSKAAEMMGWEIKAGKP